MPPIPMPGRLSSHTSSMRPGRFLSAIDKITLLYCAWFVIYITIGIILGRAVDSGTHLLRHLLIAGFVLLLAFIERNSDLSQKPNHLRALRFIRGIYPVALFPLFYTSLHSVCLILFPDWLDPWFMELDRKIWGYYPSLDWGLRFNSWFIQEFFHFSYFSYYLMIIGLPIHLYMKKKPAFQELIFNLTFVFYCCYVFYSLIPVVGGRILTDAYQLTLSYRGGLFTHIMAFIYSHSGHWGGAFPSSHVAIAVVLTIAALKFTRRWGYVFGVASLFLTIATVYCHYHWFVDAVAGLVTGVLGYYAGNWIRLKLTGNQA